MTNSDRIELRNFESEVRQLLKSYKSLKSEVSGLRKQIALKDEAIERLEGELRNSRRLYSNLKTAKMLEVSDSDVKESKLRITRLVREVNKCIRLLSAEEIDDELQEDETLAVSDVKEEIPAKGKEEDVKEKEAVLEEENVVLEEPEEIESVEEENIIEETGDEISEEESIEEETVEEEIKEEEREVAEIEEEETVEDEIKEEESIDIEKEAVENVKEETSEASSLEESVEGEEKVEEESKESEKVEKKVRSSKSKKEVDPWDFGMLPLFPDDDL